MPGVHQKAGPALENRSGQLPSRWTRNIMNLPILKYIPEHDDDKLLNHEMTSDEKQLFRELDAAATAVSDNELKAIYKVILPLGLKHGLDENETIAFWTRSAFRLFESSEYSPKKTEEEPPTEFNDLMFLALDHGLSCIEDGNGPLIPFAMTHTKGGERKLQRFVCDRIEEGIDRAKAFVEEHYNEISMYAVAWDGYITLEGKKWDAIFVEAGMRDRFTGYLLCQRYKTRKKLFRKENVAEGNPALVGNPPSRIYGN
jgi:hypothetical protein